MNKLHGINKRMPFNIVTSKKGSTGKTWRAMEKQKEEEEHRIAIKKIHEESTKELEAYSIKRAVLVAQRVVDQMESKLQLLSLDMTEDDMDALRKSYYPERKRIWNEYKNPNKLPKGTAELIELEKHPVIIDMMIEWNLSSMQDAIDHDTLILQSRK